MAMDPSMLAGGGPPPMAPGLGGPQGMAMPGAMPPLPPPAKRRKRGGKPKVRHRKNLRGAKRG